MSKATELAKCLDLYDDDQTAVHAAAHLRALDASHRQLLEALEDLRTFGKLSYYHRIKGQNDVWCDLVDSARTAIAAAKELT